MLVLIADDEPETCTIVSAILQRAGHRSVIVRDAMSVMQAAMRTPQPDAVVLDIQMPAGTGISALERLKGAGRTSHIPVIILTASTDPAVEAKALALGAAAFLHKPVDEYALLNALAGGPPG